MNLLIQTMTVMTLIKEFVDTLRNRIDNVRGQDKYWKDVVTEEKKKRKRRRQCRFRLKDFLDDKE